MKPLACVLALALLAGFFLLPAPAGDDTPLARLQAEFAAYSGAKLVFTADELPEGPYLDILPPLDDDARERAARIALHEVRKFPRRYLGRAGLEAIGIFAACASRDNDGFHTYDEDLKGYRYYGVYNNRDALAAAYYSDRQLARTLHHEIFHHIDAILRGKPGNKAIFRRDERFATAISGEKPYAAPRIDEADLAALKDRAPGRVLEDAVGKYAEKSPGEDKAETARYLMTTLPDALVQIATRPELPGTQRMIHVLAKYERAIPDGPGVDWFVAVALGRAPAVPTRKAGPRPN
jgi:hypothetical protein